MHDIIAFAGLKGSGKDTAGSVFTDHGYKLVKFADALKCMIHVLLMFRGADADHAYACIEDEATKETPSPYLEGKTPRQAMQTLGTEWGRNLVGQDIWINAFNDHVAKLHGEKIVITDCRFPNEVAAIRALGGHVVRINRAGQKTTDLHESERHIPTLDVHMDLSNHFNSAEEFKVAVRRLFFTH